MKYLHVLYQSLIRRLEKDRRKKTPQYYLSEILRECVDSLIHEELINLKKNREKVPYCGLLVQNEPCIVDSGRVLTNETITGT